jgi:hypothetical protein
MTQREKNSFSLLVLVLVILAFFVLITPFFRFSIPRLFVHDWMGVQMDGIGHHLHFGMTNMVRMLPFFLIYIVWAAVAIWVYQDARQRGQNGLLWALFVFIGNIIGLILYLLLRASSPERAAPPAVEPSAVCPACGLAVLDSYVACPHCAHALARSCAACGKRLETGWKACPYCGQAAAGE